MSTTRAPGPETSADPAAGPALPRLPRAVRSLVAAHVVLLVVFAFRAVLVPLNGDEPSYADGAKALSDVLRALTGSLSVDPGLIRDSLVGNGWFMPGMTLVLTPLYAVDPDPTLTVVRLYLAAFHLVLFLLALGAVRRVLGDRYAVAFLVFPGLAPLYLLQSFGGWGDEAAGLLVVVLVTRLVALLRLVRAGRAPDLRWGAGFGLLCIACLYLRSSSLPVVAVAFAAAAVGILVLLPRPRWIAGLTSLALGAGVFLVLLLPWSVVASATLGGRVVTTTTVPVSMAVTFGEQDRICFGPCGDSNIWFATVRYSRAVAERTGDDELAVQDQMSTYARADLTWPAYAEQVLDDVGRYVFEPTWILPVYGQHFYAPVTWLLRVTTLAGYAVFLLALVVACLRVARGPTAADVLVALLLRAFVVAVMVQPFVHISTGRYWPVFAGLMGLAGGLLWTRRSEAGDEGPRVLVAGQAVLTTVLVGVTALVVGVSLL